MTTVTSNHQRANGLGFFWGLMVSMFLVSKIASADLRIDVTQGRADPMPIALNDFVGIDDNYSQVGSDISRVIAQNLERSGLFAPINKEAFIKKAVPLDRRPEFSNWKVLNAQAMVHGRVNVEDDGRLNIQFRLWDTFAEQQMVGNSYFTTPKNWRRVAHIISDLIYKRITGEDGYFDTRIVYISESGSKDRRRKRLAIMDQDELTTAFSPTDLIWC